MNTTLLSVLICLFLMIGLVSGAIYHPLPINGKVSGLDIENIPIQVENIRTGEILSTSTTASGEFLVDWANSNDRDGTILKFVLGDKFKISLAQCTSDECIQYMTYNGEPNLFVSFDISDSQICPVKVCPIVTCPVCDCPVIPCEDTVCPVITCPVCDCETSTWRDLSVGAVLGLIIGLVAFMGGGMKFYKKRTGGIEAHHRHKGKRDYHSINVLHNDLRYAHARFKDDPIKFITDVKKIEEKGGLI